MSFDEAFEKALESRKYDVLTGRAPNIREIINRAIEHIYETFIKPLFKRLGNNTQDINIPKITPANTIQTVFIAAAAVLLAAAAVFIFMRLKRRARRKQTMQEIFDELRTGAVTYEELLRNAAKFAEKGLYRDAVRYEYISLLWVLNNYSVIYLTDYKTNSQIKREIQQNAPLIHERFSGVVNMFNIAWFGHKKITPESYNDNRERVNELIKEVRLYKKAA